MAIDKDDPVTAREALARSDRAAAGPYVTPKVRAEAQRSGVDLNAVTGTGAGGRIRLKDVQAAADSTPAGRLAKVDREQQTMAAWSSASRGPEYARNPLVDHVLRAQPQAAAQAKMPRPTLFATGDVPVFCASGIDPAALLQVPWQARYAVASAPTSEAAFRLVQMYAGDPVAAADDFGSSEPVVDYAGRVQAWAASGMTEGEVYAALGFDAADEATRARRNLGQYDNDAVSRRTR